MSFVDEVIGLFGDSGDVAAQAAGDAVGGSSDTILAALNGIPDAAGGGSSLLSGLVDWAKANPQLAAAAFGAVGPTASLIGNLASGGQGPTQTGTTSGTTSGQQSVSRTNQSQGTDTQSAFGNRTEQATLDPAAQQAMDRLTAMLTANQSGAMGANTDALGMLSQLAQGQMSKMGAGGGPPTSPSAAPVTGFPTELPTTYNPAIGNLIKQAFGSFVGDLGAQAITNARGRGFAGGADLLNSAAAPMMGQTLAQVPAMQAKAYLDHVLQAYGLQSENAARQNAAGANALNAATNALGPGITKYGIDRSADTADLNATGNLLQLLMQPQRDLYTANTNLLNAAPRGRTDTSLSGSTRNTSLSGSDTALSNSSGTTSGQTSGTSTTPIPSLVGTGLGNIAQGAATGVAAQAARDAGVDFQKTLLAALAGRK